MQVTTALSDALGRYLDLASRGNKSDGQQYGQRRYSGVQDAGI